MEVCASTIKFLSTFFRLIVYSVDIVLEKTHTKKVKNSITFYWETFRFTLKNIFDLMQIERYHLNVKRNKYNLLAPQNNSLHVY